ncbi:Retrovirus-related Pol poly from transposon [Paramuricea clavata]|uniref:Retrovirus-related Pol poly from transposon n=1 Tax=Paramuricea clavata TaxID=317549 RepID=A0A6S7ISX0_PARCT|nr:Retrovirus-related Pol poly from transposon [Paramuricea clavata]
MLAVLFGFEKFHYYVYGRHVVIHSDHQAIFKKHLASATPRISRMMLRIQTYDVQIKYSMYLSYESTSDPRRNHEGRNLERSLQDYLRMMAGEKEPLVSHDIPPRPWYTLGSVIFHWNNADYLLVTDYYSKFSVIRKLPNFQSSTVVGNLKAIFEEHGIPSKMISDNGTQYTSSTFQEFSRAYGFTHVTSSPMYPQSNGPSERAVQTVKRLLQKCKESNLGPHLAMLCLRSTPLSHDLPSPEELLNSRIY